MNVQPGDIGFVMHHDSKLSKVIAWFMGSRWSHSFMVCEVTEPRTFLIETSDYEITYGKLERYTRDKNCEVEVWSPIGASDSQRDNAVLECERHIEEMYGYLQLVSLGLRRLLMHIKIRIKNFIRIGHVCDEAVLEGARFYSGLTNIDPKSIDTEELYELIVKSGQFTKVL